jgi:hypothetical protein
MANRPFKFQDGDVLLTYGTGGWWPPRRWLYWILYRAIRRYQKERWGNNYRATHCRVWLGKEFFEATVPNCQWVTLESLVLGKKDWCVARPRFTLDVQGMYLRAGALNGTPYDKGDLIDFELSRIFGWRLHVFGDRAHKYAVCSTAAASVILAGGGMIRGPDHMPVVADAVDPATFENQPVHLWEVLRP